MDYLVCFDAESRGDFPHFDGLVPGTAEDVVSGRHETDTGHIVVVALQCFGTLVAVYGVGLITNTIFS